MIGSHNTFTYLPNLLKIFSPFKRLWQCQNMTIDKQYAMGIRFFDIRVVCINNRWYAAHGIVTIDGYFDSLREICDTMEEFFPEAIYRIVLEREDNAGRKQFMAESQKLCSKYHNLWRVIIKENNSLAWLGIHDNDIPLYDRGYKFALGQTWEEPSHELTGHVTKSNWWKVSLKKEAKKINSQLPFFNDKDKLQQMIKSKDELYLLDFCTNEY